MIRRAEIRLHILLGAALMAAQGPRPEAIEAYEMYRQDAKGDVEQLFDDLLNEDRRQAERLLAALRTELR